MPPMAATGKADPVGGVGVVVGCLGNVVVVREAVVVLLVVFLDVVVAAADGTRSGPAQPLKQSWSCSPLVPVQGFDMSEFPPGHLHWVQVLVSLENVFPSHNAEM